MKGVLKFEVIIYHIIPFHPLFHLLKVVSYNVLTTDEYYDHPSFTRLQPACCVADTPGLFREIRILTLTGPFFPSLHLFLKYTHK